MYFWHLRINLGRGLVHLAAMVKKNGGQPEVAALADPVQAALLKAAQRKMRCAKPAAPEETPGPGPSSVFESWVSEWLTRK